MSPACRVQKGSSWLTRRSMQRCQPGSGLTLGPCRWLSWRRAGPSDQEGGDGGEGAAPATPGGGSPRGPSPRASPRGASPPQRSPSRNTGIPGSQAREGAGPGDMSATPSNFCHLQAGGPFARRMPSQVRSSAQLDVCKPCGCNEGVCRSMQCQRPGVMSKPGVGGGRPDPLQRGAAGMLSSQSLQHEHPAFLLPLPCCSSIADSTPPGCRATCRVRSWRQKRVLLNNRQAGKGCHDVLRHGQRSSVCIQMARPGAIVALVARRWW